MEAAADAAAAAGCAANDTTHGASVRARGPFPVQHAFDPQPTQAPEPQPTATVGEQQTAPTNTAGTQVPAASGCDPAKEPHRRYLGDREKCMLIKYRCEPPQNFFSNACGCE
ncbi:hypothetical protein [Polyangium sp. 15x6]|uniref:hypothetical protein n=1 Tax=Polyangium sp. 15x6 TaxID=3042687 RepID=UPI00249BE71C|nr:hypothetical protein [Polyangium sp. 15x6]MDI3288191.1 hypothetical protein [Polyangium sp. 15x6]